MNTTPESAASPIPTLAVDHVAFNVPNLEDAVRFFTTVLGCEVVRRGGPMARGTALTATFAFVRYDPSLAFELLEWRGPDVQQLIPGFTDTGGGHLAFAVADLEASLAAVAARPGLHAEPVEELPDGRRFSRFTTPWGLTVQLLTRLPPPDPGGSRSQDD